MSRWASRLLPWRWGRPFATPTPRRAKRNPWRLRMGPGTALEEQQCPAFLFPPEQAVFVSISRPTPASILFCRHQEHTVPPRAGRGWRPAQSSIKIVPFMLRCALAGIHVRADSGEGDTEHKRSFSDWGGASRRLLCSSKIGYQSSGMSAFPWPRHFSTIADWNHGSSFRSA